LIATLLPLHRQLASTGVLYMAAAGVIGLWMWWRKKPMDANYRGILTIGYILGDVIGLLGLVMLLAGASPRDPIHILYGVVTAVSIPGMGAWQIQRGHADIDKPKWYALAAFFTMGVMLRGITTATR
jgi:uncharacterized membrane protein YfcA